MKHVTTKGNKLEFLIKTNSLVVIDNSCLMEYEYKIGNKEILDLSSDDEVEIKSFKQVKEAWINEKVWFGGIEGDEIEEFDLDF